MPERDAAKVMKALDGTTYKGREVRCNEADDKGHGRKSESKGREDKRGNSRNAESMKSSDKPKKRRESPKKAFVEENNGDWRQFFKNNNVKFKDDEPDFSEEGWALRKPRKK